MPPYFIVYRSGGGSGSSIVLDDGETVDQAVGVLFSTRAIAERFIEQNGLLDDGWRVGELSRWQDVAIFIDSYRDLKKASLDSRRLSFSESYAVVDSGDLHPVLHDLATRSRAREEAPRAPASRAG